MSNIESAYVNPHEKWRNYTRSSAIPGCKVSQEDIKKLYKLFQEKQNIELETMLKELSLLESETAENFENRKKDIRNAYITTIEIKLASGEIITGHGESFLDDRQKDGGILSISFDTSFTPKASLNFTPRNLANITLDFSQPSLLEISANPSSHTPNGSQWFIRGNNEEWVTSFGTRMKEFFEQRATSTDWLHRPAAYDGWLVLIGIPICLWGSMQIVPHLISSSLAAPLVTGTYIYIFVICANLFRSMFAYAKWIFPKVELTAVNSKPAFHRYIWLTITLAVLGSAVYDLIKS